MIEKALARSRDSLDMKNVANIVIEIKGGANQ